MAADHLKPRLSVDVAAQQPVSTPSMNSPTTLQSATDAGIEVLLNRRLENDEEGTTDLVSEPTAAARGNLVLFTANSFAAVTENVQDMTRRFQPVDPADLFGPSRRGRFCCDQSVVYDRGRDLLIWLLQYDPDSTENLLRVAVSQGADIERRIWYFYELSPIAVSGWNHHYFDFSSITLGENYLYISTNTAAVGQTQSFERGVVIRLPLERLARYRRLSYDFFSVGGVVELRATEGAAKTMHWGAHVFADGRPFIRVYSWPEDRNTVEFRDSKVGPWKSVSAADPDFGVWLGRIDPAITAAWYTSGKLGFAWTAGQDSVHPRPHVRVAILSEGSWSVEEEPHLWSRDITFAYPVASPDAQGIVGVSLQYSDQNNRPSHAIGVLRGSGWSLVSTRTGTDAPERSDMWGDYLSIQPDGRGWIATGYTLQGGNTAANVENLVIRFAVP